MRAQVRLPRRTVHPAAIWYLAVCSKMATRRSASEKV